MAKTSTSKKLCGIYKFLEKSTNKVYIGQSKDIIRRFYEHYTTAANEWERRLQDHPEDWTFEIVELCSEMKLNALEAHYISQYDSYKNGLNKTPGNINSLERHYQEIITKELKKPTAQWCLEDFISDACASEDDAEAYKIQSIKFVKPLAKPNGQLMAYLLLLKLRYAEVPITIFLTNESIPYNVDMMLRKEYPYYYYNSMIPYHGGYKIEQKKFALDFVKPIKIDN